MSAEGSQRAWEWQRIAGQRTGRPRMSWLYNVKAWTGLTPEWQLIETTR